MLRNYWYAIEESRNVSSKKILKVTRFDRDFVLWRDKTGTVSCFEDRCPHRRTKLSLGRLKDGELECAFHGMRFGSHGRCVYIPSEGKNSKLPGKLKVETFEIREHANLVWFWWGDPREVYPPLPNFPDCPPSDAPKVTFSGELPLSLSRLMEASFDFSHFAFVHRGYFFNTDPQQTYAKNFQAKTIGNQINFSGTFCKDEDEAKKDNSGIRGEGTIIFPALVRYNSSLEPPGCETYFFHAPISGRRTWYHLNYYYPKGPFIKIRGWIRKQILFKIIWKQFLLKQDLRMWLAQDPLESGAKHDQLIATPDIGIRSYLKLWREAQASIKNENVERKRAYATAEMESSPSL